MGVIINLYITSSWATLYREPLTFYDYSGNIVMTNDLDRHIRVIYEWENRGDKYYRNVSHLEYYGCRYEQVRDKREKRSETYESKFKSAEELREHLDRYQLEVIRSGLPPLPIALSRERADILISEGYNLNNVVIND